MCDGKSPQEGYIGDQIDQYDEQPGNETDADSDQDCQTGNDQQALFIIIPVGLNVFGRYKRIKGNGNGYFTYKSVVLHSMGIQLPGFRALFYSLREMIKVVPSSILLFISMLPFISMT